MEKTNRINISWFYKVGRPVSRRNPASQAIPVRTKRVRGGNRLIRLGTDLRAIVTALGLFERSTQSMVKPRDAYIPNR